MSDNTPLRAALALGITTGALVSGINLSLSFVSIPSLLNTPAPVKIPTGALLAQWNQHYDIAKGYALPLLAVNLATYAYGLSEFHYASFRGQLLAGGIAATIGVPLFTVLWMEGPLGSTNLKLMKLNREVNASSEVVSEAEEKHVRGLCEHWAVLCTIRAMFPLAASVLGIWAVM